MVGNACACTLEVTLGAAEWSIWVPSPLFLIVNQAVTY